VSTGGGWLDAGGLKMPEVSVCGGGFPKGNTYRLEFEEVEMALWWTLQAENQELKTPFAGVELGPP